MPEGFINVTEGSGKKAHTFQRTIGANTVEDEAVFQAEYPYTSYFLTAASVITTTAASHMLQIMAGASLPVRIRRIFATSNVAPAAVTACPLQIVRLTTAGTGGGAVTARPHDSADAAAGATGMTLPTVKGTEGVILYDQTIWLGTGAIPVRDPFKWEHLPNIKPIIIPAGATNGIALKNTAGIATSTLSIVIEFVETNFV